MGIDNSYLVRVLNKDRKPSVAMFAKLETILLGSDNTLGFA
jgi:hypothetical protein